MNPTKNLQIFVGLTWPILQEFLKNWLKMIAKKLVQPNQIY
jgi:hypothetical protein